MGTGITQEVLTIHQPEEVSILLTRSLVFRFYDVLKKHLHGRKKIKAIKQWPEPQSVQDI